MMSVFKNKFCIRDKAFEPQSYGTFLSCVTSCPYLSSVDLWVLCEVLLGRDFLAGPVVIGWG